ITRAMSPSDRLTETRAPVAHPTRGQVGVEHHRHVAHEQATDLVHPDLARVTLDQAAYLEGVERVERVGEVRRELEVVRGLDRRNDDDEVTHPRVDRVTPEAVLIGGDAALLDGPPPGLHPVPPPSEPGALLDVG